MPLCINSNIMFKNSTQSSVESLTSPTSTSLTRKKSNDLCNATTPPMKPHFTQDDKRFGNYDSLQKQSSMFEIRSLTALRSNTNDLTDSCESHSDVSDSTNVASDQVVNKGYLHRMKPRQYQSMKELNGTENRSSKLLIDKSVSFQKNEVKLHLSPQKQSKNSILESQSSILQSSGKSSKNDRSKGSPKVHNNHSSSDEIKHTTITKLKDHSAATKNAKTASKQTRKSKKVETNVEVLSGLQITKCESERTLLTMQPSPRKMIDGSLYEPVIPSYDNKNKEKIRKISSSSPTKMRSMRSMVQKQLSDKHLLGTSNFEPVTPKFSSPRNRKAPTTLRTRTRSLSPRKQSERTLQEKASENTVSSIKISDSPKLDSQQDVVNEPKSPSKFRKETKINERSCTPVASASNVFFDANEWLNQIGAQGNNEGRKSSSVRPLNVHNQASSNPVSSPESNSFPTKVQFMKQKPLRRYDSIRLEKQDSSILDGSSMNCRSSSRCSSPVNEKRLAKHTPTSFSDITVRNKECSHEPSVNTHGARDTPSGDISKVVVSPKKAIRKLHSRSSSTTTFNSKSTKSLINMDICIPYSPTKNAATEEDFDSSSNANKTPNVGDKFRQRRESLSPSRNREFRSQRNVLAEQNSPIKNRHNPRDFDAVASPAKLHSRRHLKSTDLHGLGSPERLRLVQSPERRRHSSILEPLEFADESIKPKTRSCRTIIIASPKDVTPQSHPTNNATNLEYRSDECCQADDKLEKHDNHNDPNLSKRHLGKHGANPRRRLSIQSGRSSLSLMSMSAVTPVKPGDAAVYRKAKSNRRASLNSTIATTIENHDDDNTVKTPEERAAYYSSDDMKCKPANAQRSPKKEQDVIESESASPLEESKLPFGIPRVITIPDDFEFSD